MLSIASVVSAWAVPGTEHWMNDARLSSQANGLLADLALARNESIRHGKRVVLCVSRDGVSCASSGSWQEGRIAFVDDNNNAQRDAGETVLLTEAAAATGWSITGNSNVARYVSYHPLGMARLVSGGFQAGTITICARSSTPVWAVHIVISKAGRPRSVREKVGTCDV